MKIAHILLAFVLLVLLTGLTMGLATANVPGQPAAARMSPDVYAGFPLRQNPAESGMPRVSVIAVPTPLTVGGRQAGNATLKASPTAMASPTVKYMKVQPLATMKASPTAKVSATPKASATMKPTVKYMQARPPGTTKVSPTPTVKVSPSPTARTPAQSYGIFGLGGPVPSPRAATVTPKAVPSGSPTPVPGGFTPRFPGEPGAGKASPTPTAVPAVTSSPTSNVTIPRTSLGGSSGMYAGSPPLTDPSRYAARGPGVVSGVVFQSPASAPGPLASPSARPIKR